MDKIVSFAAYKQARQAKWEGQLHGETMESGHNPATDMSYRDMVELPNLHTFFASINSGVSGL